MANQLVNNFVGVAVAVIMGLGVTVSIIQSVTSSANLTGINLTVANYLPTFIIVGLLMIIVNLFY